MLTLTRYRHSIRGTSSHLVSVLQEGGGGGGGGGRKKEEEKKKKKEKRKKDVPLAQFMYLEFTRMPGESYRRRLRSLLCLCYVFPNGTTYFQR